MTTISPRNRLTFTALAVFASATSALADGACCVNNICLEVPDEVACIALGGSYYGDDTTCPDNGYCPEDTPRAGESRFPRHQFLSSHNSYSGNSLTFLLDAYNYWEIELDVRWTDPCVGATGFWVMHHCGDLDGEGWLHEFLDEIADTQRMEDGFFVLNIELDDGYSCLGCFDGPTFPSDVGEQLEDMLVASFGLSAIYTWTDFVADGQVWPSPQELVRRGKHVAINHNRSGALTDLFFYRSGLGSVANQAAFWNTDNQDAEIPDQQDQAITRRYPAHDCASESTENWETAFDNGFNFASTNCTTTRIDSHYQLMHPPLPTYVVADSPNPSGALGTALNAYGGGLGLYQAVSHSADYSDHIVQMNRPGGVVPTAHPSIITIVLAPNAISENAAFDVSDPTGLLDGILDGPVLLIAPFGAVTLE